MLSFVRMSTIPCSRLSIGEAPAATDVADPEESIVATLVLPEAQVALAVMFFILPSE